MLVQHSKAARGLLSAAAVAIALACRNVSAAPIAVEWNQPTNGPARVARPFGGFLQDGSFLVAGGSDFEGGEKVFRKDVFVRAADGSWTKAGELPQPVAEGVCAAVKDGLFCAGGTADKDAATVFKSAFVLRKDASAEALPDLPDCLGQYDLVQLFAFRKASRPDLIDALGKRHRRKLGASLK